MAGKVGTLRQSFLDKSRERLLLSRKVYSDFGLNSPDTGRDDDDAGVRIRCFINSPIPLPTSGTHLHDLAGKLYEMGRSDPRKIVFASKMGLSLALVSLVIFFKEPLANLSYYSIWAVLTVVVVVEFSVGATLNKRFNRALGTFSAGGLALGIAELSDFAGDFQEVIIHCRF